MREDSRRCCAPVLSCAVWHLGACACACACGCCGLSRAHRAQCAGDHGCGFHGLGVLVCGGHRTPRPRSRGAAGEAAARAAAVSSPGNVLRESESVPAASSLARSSRLASSQSSEWSVPAMPSIWARASCSTAVSSVWARAVSAWCAAFCASAAILAARCSASAPATPAE
jgi:hypothetical protein